MADAEPEVQWAMNFCAGQIGIHEPHFRSRCIKLGEALGLYKDERVAKNCTPNYLPEFDAPKRFEQPSRIGQHVTQWFHILNAQHKHRSIRGRWALLCFALEATKNKKAAVSRKPS